MVKVQVLGATNCKDTRQALDHLRSLGVEHEFIDIDRDRPAEQTVETLERRRTKNSDISIF